jgi:hypothetical protein
MPDEIPTQESIIKDFPRLGSDDSFDFRCGKDLDCFTCCCQDVSIVLTPYDILRMKKALGVTSSEFLDEYTISPFTKDQKIPAVLIKMDPEGKRCLLVSDDGCTIYANRPWACRMYPLGVADPKTATPTDRRFHFMLKEDLCHGHGKGKVFMVREWIEDQGIEEYDMMGASFKELMLHDFWDRDEDLTPQQMEMYHMACYDLDRFRRFVFETKFLDLFEVDEARVEVMRGNDEELLEFAMQWLRFGLFNERTMKIKSSVVDAHKRAAEQATKPAAGNDEKHERLTDSDG